MFTINQSAKHLLHGTVGLRDALLGFFVEQKSLVALARLLQQQTEAVQHAARLAGARAHGCGFRVVLVLAASQLGLLHRLSDFRALSLGHTLLADLLANVSLGTVARVLDQQPEASKLALVLARQRAHLRHLNVLLVLATGNVLVVVRVEGGWALFDSHTLAADHVTHVARLASARWLVDQTQAVHHVAILAVDRAHIRGVVQLFVLAGAFQFYKIRI